MRLEITSFANVPDTIPEIKIFYATIVKKQLPTILLDLNKLEDHFFKKATIKGTKPTLLVLSLTQIKAKVCSNHISQRCQMVKDLSIKKSRGITL